MRILQVSPFYPPHAGGIDYHVETLSNKLVEAGHEVTVYTSNVPKSKKYEVINGIEIHRFNSLCAPLNNQIVPGLFFELIKSKRFDVIHAHGHVHMSSNLTAFSRMFRKRPIVLTSHGAIPGYQGWKKGIELVFHKTLGKWTLRSADRIIALSPTQADILEGLGANRGDTTIIPPGVDLSQINLQADTEKFKSSYGLNGKKIVLFVGLLIPRKGIEYLIEAAKYTKTKPTILIIGGEPPGHIGNKQALEQLVKELGLEGDILFLGNFPREDLGPPYLAADLFVIPSLAEGLPIVLLEAMAYGKCCVATNIPGSCDAIRDGENGILFEPKNSLQLAEKIDYLLENANIREKLGADARDDIEEMYGWDAIFEKILNVYHEVSG